MYLFVAICIIAYCLLKEWIESEIPDDSYFDREEYQRDTKNNVDWKVRKRKLQNCEYYKKKKIVLKVTERGIFIVFIDCNSNYNLLYSKRFSPI